MTASFFRRVRRCAAMIRQLCWWKFGTCHTEDPATGALPSEIRDFYYNTWNTSLDLFSREPEPLLRLWHGCSYFSTVVPAWLVSASFLRMRFSRPLAGSSFRAAFNQDFRFGHPGKIRVLRSMARMQDLGSTLTIDTPFAPVSVAECRSIAAFERAGRLFTDTAPSSSLFSNPASLLRLSPSLVSRLAQATPLGDRNQMNVIRHQAVAKQRDAVALRAFAESFEIETPVVVEQEHGLAIVAPLRDVMRHTRRHHPGHPGHSISKNGYCLTVRELSPISPIS